VPAWGGARSGEPAAGVSETLDQRMAAIAVAQRQVAEKLNERRRHHAARLRALYRIARPQEARLWVDPEARTLAARRRAAALALARDREELVTLSKELVALEGQRATVARALTEGAAYPQAKTLYRPVAKGQVVARFGVYRDPASNVQLRRRGIEFASERGHNIRAVADGEVVFAGELRGLGPALVMRHGSPRTQGTLTSAPSGRSIRLNRAGYWSVLAGFARLAVQRGALVARGQVLGESAGQRVYVEVRLRAGTAGIPIDPEPLLAP
jgi:septal ring factor EnvC (AmiA/AmiB activator)